MSDSSTIPLGVPPQAQRHRGQVLQAVTPTARPDSYFSEADGYAPAIERFVQADVAAPDAFDTRTLNRYVYSLDDPVNRFDPTGEEWNLVSVMTAVSVAGTLAMLAHVSYQLGSPTLLVASGLGIFPVLNSGPLQRMDARVHFGFGGGYIGRGIGPTAGFEVLDFQKLRRRATYVYAGTQLSTKGASAGIYGTPSVLPKVGVYDTPTTDSYQGYFFNFSFSSGAIMRQNLHVEPGQRAAGRFLQTASRGSGCICLVAHGDVPVRRANSNHQSEQLLWPVRRSIQSFACGRDRL